MPLRTPASCIGGSHCWRDEIWWTKPSVLCPPKMTPARKSKVIRLHGFGGNTAWRAAYQSDRSVRMSEILSAIVAPLPSASARTGLLAGCACAPQQKQQQAPLRLPRRQRRACGAGRSTCYSCMTVTRRSSAVRAARRWCPNRRRNVDASRPAPKFAGISASPDSHPER